MGREAVLRGFAGDGVCGPVTRNGLGPRFPGLVDVLGHGYYGERGPWIGADVVVFLAPLALSTTHQN